MADSKTHYDILGVPSDADAARIKAAYRRLIRRHHPDQFTGERARLMREGRSLAAIERKIKRAERTTQRVNAAYSVLSDPDKRRAYDRDQREKRRQRQPVYRHRDAVYDDRRTYKARPHRRPHRPQRNASNSSEAVPWALMVAFLIVVGLSSSFIVDFLWSIDNTGRRVTITPIGYSASELQATTSARHATRSARSTVVNQPTYTPRPAESNINIADRLMTNGLYAQAVELYARALEADSGDATLHVKQGQAYAAIYADSRTTDDFSQALHHFDTALNLDTSVQTVYQARGWLYYDHWQQTDDMQSAAMALSDLTRYADSRSDADDTLQNTLSELRAALESG
jgi:curved DNA-binding protein CbpA